MLVRLIAHTQLEKSFRESLEKALLEQITDGQAAAFMAIRTCYSPEVPTAILAKDGEKYFLEKTPAGDTKADRLFSRIARNRHLSTLEHLSFTFAVEGISRACLAQLSRHRHISLSVQSEIRREIERVEPWTKMLFEEVAGKIGSMKTWGNQEGATHEQSNVQQ